MSLGRERLLGLSSLVFAGLACCQVIGGFDDYVVVDEAAGGAPSATSSGSTGGGGSGAGVCSLSTPPAAPTDATPGGELDLTFAVRAFDLGEEEDRDRPVKGSFDLDGRCTCHDDSCACAGPPTCARPPALAPKDEWNTCDGPGGADANSELLFALVKTFNNALSSATISESIEDGLWTAMFRVKDYNGEANDSKVVVSYFPAASRDDDTCDDVWKNAGGGGAAPVFPPNWDGEDVWSIDEDSVFNTKPVECDGDEPLPKFFDKDAHVTDDQVVAKLDELTFVTYLYGIPLRTRLKDVQLVLPLRKDGEKWLIEDGVVVGKWAVPDVLLLAKELANANMAACAVAQELGDRLCSHADVSTEASPDEPCNAVSYSLGIQAEQAKLGASVAFPVATDGCPDVTLDCNVPYDR